MTRSGWRNTEVVHHPGDQPDNGYGGAAATIVSYVTFAAHGFQHAAPDVPRHAGDVGPSIAALRAVAPFTLPTPLVRTIGGHWALALRLPGGAAGAAGVKEQALASLRAG